jgi:diacylglycerol kinase (ATP)
MNTIRPSDATQGRVAVIYNPIRITEQFRRRVEKALQRMGCTDSRWLETSKEDAGTAMTAQAVQEEADLVIGIGGDGTIRMIAGGLAGTNIPLGLIPAGTGNLLARNLNLPLDPDEALRVALGGHNRTIDLIKLSVDNREPQHFAVMAGIGVDAMIMDETDPSLKEKIGPAAYFIAAGKALGRLPVKVTIRLDDHRPMRRQAMLCVIGNVGELVGNIALIPDAQPDDGLLDLYVASPQRLSHWVKVIVRLITRRPQKDDQVDQLKGKTVTIYIDGSDSYQLDGDAVGECSVLRAEIHPGALKVCVAE